MGTLYRSILRPALFALPPEAAHALAAQPLAVLHRSRAVRDLVGRETCPAPDPALEVRAFGRRFASPLGVAAGFDKDARLYNGLAALGFSFVEVGTITARAQPGNPRPRLFRLPADAALINRMGFNNNGCSAAERSLSEVPPDGVLLGVNLGKSKVTALEDAADDYAESARRLGRFADYVVVNVSSPNTPGLRSLQSAEALRPVLRAVLAALPPPAPAVMVKIAPDLDDDAVDALVDLCLAEGVAGIVATNTSVSRAGLRTPTAVLDALGPGGLSGRPVAARSTELIRRIYRRSGRSLAIIGVGGVFGADDAWEKIAAGASLVQAFTGFVYEGHTFARTVREGLARRLDREGLASIEHLIGRDATVAAPPR